MTTNELLVELCRGDNAVSLEQVELWSPKLHRAWLVRCDSQWDKRKIRTTWASVDLEDALMGAIAERDRMRGDK